jgi:hypothetical protein
MAQAALGSHRDSVSALPSLRMDRVVSWLTNPAGRLAQMLRAMPGYDMVNHVGLSLHEGATDLLWMFSCLAPQTGVQEVEMRNVPSLSLLVGAQEPRIIHDLAEFGGDSRAHTTGARMSDCRSSMTAPLYHQGEFLGFVSFGAKRPAFFDREAREMLTVYAEAFGILVSRAKDEVCA